MENTMRYPILAIPLLTAILLVGHGAYAQFGGVVYDPTQSAHAIQQLAQGSQLYTTTLKTTENAIAAYNLAQRMATSPGSLYQPFLAPSSYWVDLQAGANTYNNTTAWVAAINTGVGAMTGYQRTTVQSVSQLPGYGTLSAEAQQQIAAEGATSDLNDSVTASNLQTLGTIRANSEKRQVDITNLENAALSTDPTQHTELATLQRINQALLLLLKQQQESNQIAQAYALQQLITGKQQQDVLKMTFRQANEFQSGYVAVAPSYSGVAAAMRY
jgi:hypothetical protein